MELLSNSLDRFVQTVPLSLEEENGCFMDFSMRTISWDSLL